MAVYCGSFCLLGETFLHTELKHFPVSSQQVFGAEGLVISASRGLHSVKLSGLESCQLIREETADISE